MPAPRILLHIGTHKTGSTAIQRTLLKNRKLLRRHGILHPDSGIPDGHKNSHLELVRGVRRMKDNGTWEQLHAEIEREGLPTVVVSAEEFAKAGPREVQRVREKTADYDTTVVVYLRSEHDFMLAACRQQWKGGGFTGSYRDFLEEKIHRCDYNALVGAWADTFGDDKVQVGLYRKAIEGPGLIDDFFARLDLDPESESTILESLRRQRTLNASDPADVASAHRRLSAIQQRVPAAIVSDDRFKQLRLAARKQGPMGKILVRGLGSTAPLYTEEDLEWLREQTAESHQAFLDRFVDPPDHHFLEF